MEDKDEVFQKGVAISVWQNSGDEHSNWNHYLRRNWPFDWPFGLKSYRGDFDTTRCPDFWNNYKKDIDCAKALGCNAFRLSIEWAKIEPRQGYIDKSAVQRYHEILDYMEEQGIEANATMHHFVHPQWFSELGGFEKEENIYIFVQWARCVVELYGSRIRLWATFNEPTVGTNLGWVNGLHPPGKMLRLTLAGTVVLNILKAHVVAYYAVKALPVVGQRVQVGLVHHHLTCVAMGNGPFLAVASWVSEWMQHWWGWDLVHEWMMTGKYDWRVPILGSVVKYDFHGRPPCDWWGINYYTRMVLSGYLQPTTAPGERMTDMMYPVHAEGLYRSIKQASQYNIPIYITETGIADKSDQHRSYWIRTYLREVFRSMKEGCDVRGFYYWTLVDNFEWNMGFTMKFGLYDWEPDGSCDRVLKEGSKELVRYYKTTPDNLAELRKKVATMNFEEEEEKAREAEEVVVGKKQVAVAGMSNGAHVGRVAGAYAT